MKISFEINLLNLYTHLVNAWVTKESSKHDIIQDFDIVNFRKDSIDCKSFPIDTTYVKYTRAHSENIYKITKCPDDFKLLKFPFRKMKSFAAWLETINKYSDSEYAKMVIDCNSVGDGIYDGLSINLNTSTDSLNIPGVEFNLIKYLDDDKWDKITTGEVLGQLVIDPNILFRIKKYFSMDKDNIVYKMSFDNNKVVFSDINDDLWKLTHNNGVKTNITTGFNVHKAATSNMGNYRYDAEIIKTTSGLHMFKCSLELPKDYHFIEETYLFVLGINDNE